MSSCTGIESARLSVLLDLRNPASYLALPPAEALAEELHLEINWLPLPVPPLRPPSVPAVDDDRAIIHRRHRARAIAREIEVYSRVQGLVLHDLYRDPDPSAFNLGWLWLRERHVECLRAYLDEGFRAYWSLELDPSSIPSITALLATVSADVGEFGTWCGGTGTEVAARVAGELRERGLSGVPGYIVDGEYFIGRQHLPMIRWILGGRRGPGPI